MARIINQSAVKFMTQQLTELGPKPKEYDYDYGYSKHSIEQLKAIKITVESTHAVATYTSIKAADELELPDSLRKISVGASGSGYSASVVFDFKYFFDNSEYAVSGSDAQIVNGTMTTLRERIEKNAISRIHYFVNRDRYVVPVAGVLIYLLTFAVVRFLTLVGIWGGVWHRSTGLGATLTDSFVIALVATFLGVWMAIGVFLKWLLPYFTYAEDRSNTNRRIVLGIFSIVASGLVINLLYDLFRLMLGS